MNLKIRPVPAFNDNYIWLLQQAHNPSVCIVDPGDTLFAGGCGRIFEGTPPMMLTSLQKLSSLHSDTRVYCAHVYTLANLRFALAAEPSNQDLQDRMASTMKMREAQIPSLPATIAWENRTNPFLRCHTEVVAKTVAAHSRVEAQDVTTTFAQ